MKIVKKSVLFKTARITGWARIADPSFARVGVAGGRSTAFRAMTSQLILIRCHAKISTLGMVAKLARALYIHI